jgi:hypothetical protein
LSSANRRRLVNRQLPRGSFVAAEITPDPPGQTQPKSVAFRGTKSPPDAACGLPFALFSPTPGNSAAAATGIGRSMTA